MKTKPYLLSLLMVVLALQACSQKDIEVWETSSEGGTLVQKTEFETLENPVIIEVNSAEERQTLVGIGGSFTEATSSILAKLSKEKRQEVIDAYFGPEGARYSLTRTHIGSCDFSKGHYCYADVKGDTLLKSFTIAVDEETLLPLIKDAQAASKDGFQIVASPWTAPWWMKDNQKYVGGALLPEYQQVYANYLVKYLEAYKAKGVDIWGMTPVNEPFGNGNNWESMYFDPKYEAAFVRDYMGPTFEKAGFGNVQILGYDIRCPDTCGNTERNGFCVFRRRRGKRYQLRQIDQLIDILVLKVFEALTSATSCGAEASVAEQCLDAGFATAEVDVHLQA